MPTTSAPPLAPRLRFAVTRTARRLRQEAGGGLSPTLNAALATVAGHGPLTPSELAGHERVQRPTATRVLARLEELGLVDRAPDPADRRSSLISVSAAGRTLLRRQRSRKNQFLARRLATLEPDEVATLDRAAAILERLLDEEGRR